MNPVAQLYLSIFLIYLIYSCFENVGDYDIVDMYLYLVAVFYTFVLFASAYFFIH